MVEGDFHLDSVTRKIKAQIEEYRVRENEARLSRLALERTLKEILGDKLPQGIEPATLPAIALSPESSLPARKRRRTEGVLVALKKIMVAGGTFQLADLVKRLESEVGQAMPASTVRSMLQRDERFENVGHGKYRLSKAGIQETKGQL